MTSNLSPSILWLLERGYKQFPQRGSCTRHMRVLERTRGCPWINGFCSVVVVWVFFSSYFDKGVERQHIKLELVFCSVVVHCRPGFVWVMMGVQVNKISLCEQLIDASFGKGCVWNFQCHHQGHPWQKLCRAGIVASVSSWWGSTASQFLYK